MKFIILTLLLCFTVSAQLPDEINYSPYEQELNSLTNELSDSNYSLEQKKESLRDKLQAISYTQNLISSITSQISNDSRRLSNLQNSLPGLRSDIRGLKSDITNINIDIRSNEQKLANLKSKIQNIQREIRPIEAKIKDKRVSLKKVSNSKKLSLNKKEKLSSSLQNKRSQVAKNKKNIQKNKVSISKFESQLASSKSDLSKLNARIVNLNGQLSSAKLDEAKLKTALNTAKSSVVSARKVLKQLQTIGASPGNIEHQKKKIRTLEGKVSNFSSKHSLAKSKVRNLSNKISSAKNNKKKIESNIRNFPSKISKLKAAMNNAIRSNQSLKTEISRLETKVLAEDRVIADLSSKETRHKTTISRLIDKIAPLRNKVQNLKQRKIKVASVNNEDLRYRKKLRIKLNRTVDLHNSNKQQIPVLINSIARSEQNLLRTQKELSNLNSDEHLLRIEISQNQTIIRDLEYAQTQAKYEFEQRLSLFNSYKNEAQDIGAAQNTNGEELGIEAGLDYSHNLVLLNSHSLSEEIGSHKAKLIGTVRGEIDGYASGYDEGINAEDSISQGIEAGIVDGKANALKYAQNTLRPNFFEEFLTGLFSMDQSSNDSAQELSFNKILSIKAESVYFDDKVPSLTEEEFDKSNLLKTSLDISISKLIESDYRLASKLENFKKASFVFEALPRVPYQTVDCSNVYKGLTVYKNECEESYKQSFSSSFNTKVKETFFENYPSDFIASYDNRLSLKVDSLLANFYSKAKATSFAEAKIIGKKDAYNQNYEQSYATSYDSQIQIESSVASTQARVDVDTWILSNPIVTVTSISISTPVLKGGDTAELVIELKNISNVDSINSGVLKLVNLNKVAFSKNNYQLLDVKANSSQVMRIPFTVNPLASSSDSISIGTEFTLKGDKYKTSRLEKLTVVQNLSKNAKMNLDHSFNSTPKVKGFRKYFVHSFDFKITSIVEDISEGYDVELIPLNGAGKYLSFKKNTLNSQASRHNIQNKTSVTYVFKKSARKRKLSFKAVVKYQGNILSEKTVEMTPR